MTPEDRLAELLKAEPDLHALMLAVGRAWRERYQPNSDHVAVYVYFASDAPPTRITIPA